ncbi:MAG: hypothetical protein NXI04_25570 [Planctomycetaceae bacterium]|nr:hypothetical protein [Planctomycetaceae bacterium]
MLWLLPAITQAEELTLPVTQDNSIVMVKGEWAVNAGAAGRIRIKGNQHIVAMGFDLSAVRGRTVRSAELVCHAAAEELSAVTLSTIAAPWREASSCGLTSGIDNVDGWGAAGVRFPAVAGGNSFTLVHQTRSEIQDGRYRWNVPADMVHAMAIGVAFGLAIHEHDADYSRNPAIFSREQSAKRPVLLVEVDDRPIASPLPPSRLQLVPVDERSAQLIVQPPPAGFAYEVRVNDVVVPRHNVPLVSDASQQTIWLRDLPDDVKNSDRHVVSVVTMNRMGQKSEAVSVAGRLFHQAAVVLPDVSLPPAVPPAVSGISVIPVTDKYDRSGLAVGALPPDYRQHNPVFDGQTVRLTAAAGEVTGLQVLLRGRENVSVTCALHQRNWRIDLFQALYVPANERFVPDPLLPLPAAITLKPDQDQSVFVDLYVPFDATAGTYGGSLVISDGRKVPIELTVLPVQLPRKASFLCEMNSYGLPDHVDDYYALQQVAYDHRVHANILHYSHRTAAAGARKSNLDMRLPSGRRMDNRRYDAVMPGAMTAYWDDFVAAFGPYLDGSCFADGHRGPIPAPGFYLTFHESWPLNCRAYFSGQPDAYQAFADTPVYAQTYTSVLADFTRLAKTHGWTEAGFHVYFNNKGSLNDPQKAPWILDEPSAFWDYRALQYYGELTDHGRAADEDVRIDYRVDISRPEYCRGQLSGRSDLWVVSSSAFRNYRRLVTDRMRADGVKVWVYGTANHVHESNRQLQAWAVDAWRNGASGLVPWQTVDKTGQALRQADQLGLFIYDRDASGQTVIRHSSRLKAFRQAEQLIEYLVLVQQKQGWSDSQMQTFVDHYVDLEAIVHQQHAEDAGTVEFAANRLLQIDILRRAAIAVLSP